MVCPRDEGSGGISIVFKLRDQLLSMKYDVKSHYCKFVKNMLVPDNEYLKENYDNNTIIIATENVDLTSLSKYKCIRLNFYFNHQECNKLIKAKKEFNVFWCQAYLDYEEQWRKLRNLKTRENIICSNNSLAFVANLKVILEETKNISAGPRNIKVGCLFRKASLNLIYSKNISEILYHSSWRGLLRLPNLDSYLHCDIKELIKRCKNIKTLYCFDLFSFTPYIAAICGCDVRMIALPPFDNLRDVYQNVPFMSFGVALKNNTVEIKKAQETRDNLRKELTAIYNGEKSYAYPIETDAPGNTKLRECISNIIQEANNYFEL